MPAPRERKTVGSSTPRLTRLTPYQYLHVLDLNSQITRLVVGPTTFVRKDNEQIADGPSPLINLPPRHFCSVRNPIIKDAEGNPKLGEYNEYKLKYGETEIRLQQDWVESFPLYPGEELVTPVTRLTIIRDEEAAHVTCVHPFTDTVDGKEVKREAGEEWLIKGHTTFFPRSQVQLVRHVTASVVKENEALKLRARTTFFDKAAQVQRRTGETWLLKKQGSYMPSVHEEVDGVVTAFILTEATALHLMALQSFTDDFGSKRKAGDEWLVTHTDTQTHIPHICEHVEGTVKITTLTDQQYCVVLNPVDKNGVAQLAKKDLRKGPRSFFLYPGEVLAGDNIQAIQVLGEDEALLLRASESFVEELEDSKGLPVAKQRLPGEEWMIKGPRKYVPPVEVVVVDRRKRIALDDNEGIYVRDRKTGTIRTVTGETYLLKTTEEFWEKPLEDRIEQLLQTQASFGGKKGLTKEQRVRHRVIKYRVPHNAAVQVYDYKAQSARVIFGPELVMLEPDEHFTVISLSGGVGNKANAVQSLSLSLGPDNMDDVVNVETSDHARLRLKLSYNWQFDIDKENDEHKRKIFSVRDFVGDTCKAIGSRVRAAVASRKFEDFHKNSSSVIKQAVFGEDAKEDSSLSFAANMLLVTNVDVQSVDPIEADTRAALQESVQLAIEIATSSQEALAAHEAQREEQVAEGKLEIQRIKDQAVVESQKRELVALQCKTAALKSTGKAKAQALARAEAARIKGDAEIKQAKLKAQAAKIRADAKLAHMKAKQDQEIKFKTELDKLEIQKIQRKAEIEAKKFADIVNAIGSDTIEAIAAAGPEMQAKLLEGLGLQGFLVTDGASPVNLFNTANGLVSGNGMFGMNETKQQ